MKLILSFPSGGSYSESPSFHAPSFAFVTNAMVYAKINFMAGIRDGYVSESGRKIRQVVNIVC